MTLTRTTIDVALTAINHQRGHLRRSLQTAETDQVRRHLDTELERLNAAHAELAVELEDLEAARAAGALEAANTARKIVEADLLPGVNQNPDPASEAVRLLALADESFA